MKIRTNAGSEVEVVNEVEVAGKKFFIVDLGVCRYISGVLTRYLVCPTAQFDKSDVIRDRAEVVV